MCSEAPRVKALGNAVVFSGARGTTCGDTLMSGWRIQREGRQGMAGSLFNT